MAKKNYGGEYIRKSHTKGKKESSARTPKLSKEALYNEWQDYKKWYNKQAAKGWALADRSYVISTSFDEYMFYREQLASGFNKSSDALAEMKRMSFEASSRQVSHLANEIQNEFLDKASNEQKVEFFARFGGELPMTKEGKIDVEQLVIDNIHGAMLPLEMRTGKHHGWYGVLADMMLYVETLGFTVSWNS